MVKVGERPKGGNRNNSCSRSKVRDVSLFLAGAFFVFLQNKFQEPHHFAKLPPSYQNSSKTNKSKNDVPLLDLSPSVKDVVINIGSYIDPIMPTKEMGPCAHAIAVEPIVGDKIPPHRQLSVIHAAVSDQPGVSSMKIYNNAASSSLAKIAKKDFWNSNANRGDG